MQTSCGPRRNGGARVRVAAAAQLLRFGQSFVVAVEVVIGVYAQLGTDTKIYTHTYKTQSHSALSRRVHVSMCASCLLCVCVRAYKTENQNLLTKFFIGRLWFLCPRRLSLHTRSLSFALQGVVQRCLHVFVCVSACVLYVPLSFQCLSPKLCT